MLMALPDDWSKVGKKYRRRTPEFFYHSLPRRVAACIQARAVLRDRNAMECHTESVEVLGNNVLLCRTVARWIGKFQQGHVSTSNDQRLGRPVSVRTDLARAVIEQLIDYIKGQGEH
ncbi:uncharacterized protein TNCV_3900821 [Trichonephila clavipes]|nr:uncharacterized protein TNCV_3900821 [Trichonephila clavipes]